VGQVVLPAPQDRRRPRAVSISFAKHLPWTPDLNDTHPIARATIDPLATPFDQTVAFRLYGPVVDPDEESAEDLYSREIIREQGFDGLPHVVSWSELDRCVARGERELLRGVSEGGHADAYRAGEFFVGRGAFGAGCYTVAGPHALADARRFARGGVILRMTLKSAARVGDFEELLQRATSERDAAVRRLRSEESSDLRRAVGGTGRAAPEAIRRHYAALVEAQPAQYDTLLARSRRDSAPPQIQIPVRIPPQSAGDGMMTLDAMRPIWAMTPSTSQNLSTI
jgi:hypothetical protein